MVIKLVLKHAIVDECINTFFRTVAGNFHRVMADPNKKYQHVKVMRIPQTEEIYSFYGVTFDLNDDGTVNQYSFKYDKFIRRYFFRTRAEATTLHKQIIESSLYKENEDAQKENSWVDQVQEDLYMLCFDNSHYRTIELNPYFFSVEIIR